MGGVVFCCLLQGMVALRLGVESSDKIAQQPDVKFGKTASGNMENKQKDLSDHNKDKQPHPWAWTLMCKQHSPDSNRCSKLGCCSWDNSASSADEKCSYDPKKAGSCHTLEDDEGEADIMSAGLQILLGN